MKEDDDYEYQEEVAASGYADMLMDTERVCTDLDCTQCLASLSSLIFCALGARGMRFPIHVPSCERVLRWARKCEY